MTDLLLDTNAVLWIANGDTIAADARTALNTAHQTRKDVRVSPFAAWEIGQLAARSRITLPMNPDLWFERFLSAGGITLADMSPRMLVASSYLPGDPPRDPADRIMIATAREENLTLVTRDRHILNYAGDGHVRALAC